MDNKDEKNRKDHSHSRVEVSLKPYPSLATPQALALVNQSCSVEESPVKRLENDLALHYQASCAEEETQNPQVSFSTKFSDMFENA